MDDQEEEEESLEDDYILIEVTGEETRVLRTRRT